MEICELRKKESQDSRREHKYEGVGEAIIRKRERDR